jgi:LysR family transcriptional regulator, low CO2-responsive transcriptional regulator
MLNFTLRQLHVFEAVSRHLSYSRAAEALHLSQPAVSMQIKQLEEIAGVPLFEQLGKKVYLTEVGREFGQYCRNVLQQLAEAESMLDDFKGMRGRLSICVASTASYFTPYLLAEFCRRHAETQVSLSVTNRENVLQRLTSNEMDMAIMGRPPEHLDLDATPFMENRLAIIAPVDHPLAHARDIPLSRLAEETFLVREQGSGTRITVERFFAERGIVLTAGTEMSTNEAIKQAVQAGMGLGILSLHTVSLELETRRLTVLDVQNFPIQRHWYVVHRKGKRLSMVAQAFKNFLLEGKLLGDEEDADHDQQDPADL